MSTIALLLLSGCRSELESALDDDQADEIVVALDQRGIGAEKEREPGSEPARYRVLCDSSEVPAALATLREQDLPHRSQPGLQELFGEQGLIASPIAERARYLTAISGELSRSLEAMDGVVRARVHLGLPNATERLLDDQRPAGRASVLLVMRRGSQVDEQAVRALVAGAVPELRPEDVAVVHSRAPAPNDQPARLVQLGPIAVSRGSEGTLKAILATSFVLNLALALLFLWKRRRAPKNDRGETSGDGASPGAARETAGTPGERSSGQGASA